ncbi:MAG: class I SAM-dependent methyltransferase [Candidatus Heimdallarchaeota archaeon]|nr:MAG: class I SAM-dependent methyltransferase [Candidatus Heimdallarchaeota archaeon]
MVSPFKKLMLTFFELKVFKSFIKSINIDLSGKSILEVGCGAGYGIEQIYKNFRPKEYYVFDKNPRMVLHSAAKVKKKNLPVHLFLGDVKKTKLPSNRFDAVFIFTVLHHVEGWQFALREINRVLKPKGLLFINEINDRSLGWFERYLKIKHPKKGRFSWDMFTKGLLAANFLILREFKFLGDLGFFLCIKQPSLL